MGGGAEAAHGWKVRQSRQLVRVYGVEGRVGQQQQQQQQRSPLFQSVMGGESKCDGVVNQSVMGW